MREKKTKYQYRFSVIINIILLLNIAILSLQANAQEQNSLYIAIFDCENGEYLDDDIGYIFIEGNQYDVEVFYENETGSPTRVYDVTIDLPWASYFIANGEENSWISIETPYFEEYNEFSLVASKPGYIPAEEYIMISKGDLYITTDRATVEEEGIFLVTITDQNNNPVSGAILYIEGLGSVLDTTNENGRAHINAPDVDSGMDISITAVKGGYFPGSNTIYVENIKTTAFGEFQSKIIDASPILLSIFAVILAMIYAKLRKKSNNPISSSKLKRMKRDVKFPKIHKKINFIKNKNENLSIKQTKHDKYLQNDKSDKKTDPITINTNITEKYIQRKKKIKNKTVEKKQDPQGPHVEIIKICDTDDNKEKSQIASKEKKLKKTITTKKPNENEWIQGTDYVKYKIDKLTGESNTSDNWFVGQDNSRFVVDQKLIHKKQKKKNKSVF